MPDSHELALVLTDLADVGLLRVDAEQVVDLTNEAAQRHLGYSNRSVIGRTVLELFIDHRVSDLVAQVSDHGRHHLEVAFSGEPQRTLSLDAVPAGDGATWLLVHDQSELRRLRRIRTEFVDNLSHELRTPVTNLRLLAESLALDMERADVALPLRESVARIDAESERLAQMVTELLDLARMEQGDVPMRRDRVDLADVVANVTERLRPFAERRGVHIAAQLPDADAERLVVGDENRLEQLLVNLVHNAIKFSTEGVDSEVSISVRSDYADGKFVLLEVDDDGPGIPWRDLDRIFERFYKVDRARSRGGETGTGLGLAIARHIAEGHGGRIWAESTEGDGARFSVALPRA